MRRFPIHRRQCVNELVFSTGKNTAKYADPHKLVNILNECFLLAFELVSHSFEVEETACGQENK